MRQCPGAADCISHGDTASDTATVEPRPHVVEHAAFAAKQMCATTYVEQQAVAVGMRVSTDPWGVATQPAGAFIERGRPRAGSSISICMSGTSARASASAMPGEAASLGSDIDRRQTLCPALMFSQHKRRIALFSRHGDFTQPIGKPDCHNTPSGRRVSGAGRTGTGGTCGVDCGMIQAPHPNCRKRLWHARTRFQVSCYRKQYHQKRARFRAMGKPASLPWAVDAQNCRANAAGAPASYYAGCGDLPARCRRC